MTKEKKATEKSKKSEVKTTNQKDDFFANCENHIKDVVKEVNSLKTSVGKYSNEGLANSIPLVNSIELLRIQVGDNAKELGHNDIQSYLEKYFDKKFIRKFIFEKIGYPNKHDLTQDGKPKRDYIFEHLFDRSVDVAIGLEYPDENMGLSLVDDKMFMVVSKLAYPKVKVIGAKGVEWQDNNSETLIPLTTRLLGRITGRLKPTIKKGKGKGKKDNSTITLAKNIQTMISILQDAVDNRVRKENFLLTELNSDDIKNLANLTKLSSRLFSQYKIDLTNMNEDGHNEVKDQIYIGKMQHVIYSDFKNEKEIKTEQVS
tara:strand:+ start:311 stop:1258 length:948 start_codon:yes stop_codon:yes gene_type:complete